MAAWNNLDPYSPLNGDDPRYVARPAEAGNDIVAALQSGLGGGRIAINGPAGVGKSTELAAAERRLRDTCLVVRVILDRRMDLQKLNESELFSVLMESFGFPSKLAELEKSLSDAGFQGLDTKGLCSWEERNDAFRLLLSSLAAQGTPPTLLIDGLEKADDSAVHRVLLALAEAAMGTQTRLVIVLSPTSVVGPQAHDLLRLYKPLELRPIDVAHVDLKNETARKFFYALLEKRLDSTLASYDIETRDVILKAIAASGGIPRVFLQLLQDAAGYAALAGRDMPHSQDLQQAMDDHIDSLRYLLVKGDVEALQQAENTAGTELELERRARFLAHGLMLLQGRGSDTHLVMHPLVKRLLSQRRISV